MKAVLWMGLAALLLLPACAAGVHLSQDEALAAQLVELQVDDRGRMLEVEYHVAPQDVPAEVRMAMDRLHPGGRAVGAEKEYIGGTLYWELSKQVDGREVEAMFTPDGSLHSEEIEVDAARVPEGVKAAVAARRAGKVTQWEEIRDGSRSLVEYHAKVEADGRKYKLLVTPAGTVLAVYREVPAEIEVPLRE